MENKKSKLIFDQKMSRKLLKMNGEFKFCPCCGKALIDGCDCNTNLIIDVKKKRDSENETISVFLNTPGFQKNFDALMAEYKAKEEAKKDVASEAEVLHEF